MTGKGHDISIAEHKNMSIKTYTVFRKVSIYMNSQ